MKKTFYLILAVCLVCCANLYSGIQFAQGDINSENKVIFTVRHNLPGTNSYSSVFLGEIENGSAKEKPAVISVYPEHMEILDGGKILQLRNRYGIAWYDVEKNSFSWKKTYNQLPLNSMRLIPSAESPNGKWICYIEKTGYAIGFLVLENVLSGRKFVLDTNAGLSYESVPVKWNPDSSVFIYEKEDSVFFCTPEALAKGVETGENFRKIGKGSINSVEWADSRNLIYITSDLVYKLNSKELYTRGLYSKVIGTGTAIGRLPETFFPERDFFSVNEKITSLVLVKSGRFFSQYKIKGVGCEYLSVDYSGPYIDFNSSVLDSRIIWYDGMAPAVWIRTMPYSGGKISASVFKLDGKMVKILEIENAGKPALSPDKSKVAFYSGSTIYVYSTDTWKRVAEISGEKLSSLAWGNNDLLYIGGDKTVRSWNISEQNIQVILLSSAVNAWWSGENKITADAGNENAYVFDSVKWQWQYAGKSEPHENRVRNKDYRVYCGETGNANFENAFYIRSLTGKAVTRPMFPESTVKSAKRRQVSLVFDAYDSADGLAKILYHLNSYNITGTFFINGEFIRRYPNETRQIAFSSNECASMFFSNVNLLDSGFVVDEDFIRRGLARNEDEFYAATGKELSLLWHSPRYKVSGNIIGFAEKAGYTYVNVSEEPLDNITLEDSVALGMEYHSVPSIISVYMDNLRKNNGGIIPVTAGLSSGYRESFLHDHLDLLISAILDAGYDIVPLENNTR